jgi:hypothetical protein
MLGYFSPFGKPEMNSTGPISDLGDPGPEGGLEPLFLIGAPRSGTSLVYRALCLNPGASYITNWLNRHPHREQLSTLVRVARALPGLRSRYWFGEDSNAYRYGSRRSLLERAFPAPVEGELFFTANGLDRDRAEAPATDQVRALRRAFSGIARYGGGTVVSKRISSNRQIEILARIFPSARFVSIVRDGRAVAYSLSRVDWWEQSTVWWFGGTPLEWRESGRDPWELCAQTWVEEVRAIEKGLATVPSGQVLQLSYEDLVADPVARLRSMAEFGGLPVPDRWVAALGTLKYPNRNEGWRSGLKPNEVSVVERVEAGELRRYGYA